MRMDLDRSLLEILIAVVDHDKPEFSPEFIAGLSSANGAYLQSTGLLSDGEPYDSIWVETADGIAEALVFVDSNTNEVTLYHPEDGPILVSPDSVRRQVVNGNQFASWVMHDLFRMPKSSEPTVIVPENVWDIGTPRLGKKAGVRVILARRLHDASIREKLAAEMLLAPPHQRIVVVTTTATTPPDLRFSRVSAVVTFGDINVRDADRPSIDLERLGMFVERGSTKTIVTQKLVECADDGSWLRIRDKEYRFRAGKKTVMRMLFDAWEDGSIWVPESNLLNAGSYEAGTTLTDVFKDGRLGFKDVWREYLEIKQQRARLIVDAA